MTTSTTKKRLDNIEVHLTPKEWALRIGDEIRKYPSQEDLMRAELTRSYQESVFWRPYNLFSEQAEEREPGRKPENDSARRHLARKLRSEFHILRTIILQVNLFCMQEAETRRLKVALRLTWMQALLLQDMFGWTSKRAELLIRGCKGEDREVERRAILKDLSECSRKPLLAIEDWPNDIVLLIVEVYSRIVAVQIIQNKYFDGHAILFRDEESSLEEAMGRIEAGVDAFNEYIRAREDLMKAKGGSGGKQPIQTVDVAGIKKQVRDEWAAPLVDEWVRRSKEKAAADIFEWSASPEEQMIHDWNDLREVYGVET